MRCCRRMRIVDRLETLLDVPVKLLNARKSGKGLKESDLPFHWHFSLAMALSKWHGTFIYCGMKYRIAFSLPAAIALSSMIAFAADTKTNVTIKSGASTNETTKSTEPIKVTA